MGMIRPVLTDFSMGEVSPKLAGRVDLPLMSRAALEMKNMLIGDLGGAFKRGGLYLQENLGDEQVITIPWSVGDDLDFIIVLYDRRIKILNVSQGDTPAWIQEGGSDLEITSMSEGAPIPLYSAADLPSVQYAQSLKRIVFVHQDYRPFYIEVERGVDPDDITMAYGIMAISGNIASTQTIIEEVDVYRDMTYAQILDAFSNMIPGQNGSWDADAVLGGGAPANYGLIYEADIQREITNITLVKATTSRSFEYNGNTYYDSSSTLDLGSYRYIGTGWNTWDGYWEMSGSGSLFQWVNKKHRLEGVFPDSITPGVLSQTAILDELEAIGLRSGETYIISNNTGSKSSSLTSKRNIKLKRTTTQYTLTLYWSGGSRVITQANDTTVRGALVVPLSGGREIAINGFTSPMSDMVNRLAPWMTEDRVYQCVAGMKLNGLECISAFKRNTDDGPEIIIDLEGEDENLVLSRNSTGVSGQVGVIVTPFYDDNDNPSCVAFYQNRLVLGGSKNEPNVLYMSKTNEFANFAFFEEIEYTQTALKPTAEWGGDGSVPEYETTINTVQQIGSSSAIRLQLATEENEKITSLAAKDDLFIGTATGEWIFPSGLTALNPRVVLVSRHGTSTIRSRFIENDIVFLNQSRRRIRTFSGIDLLKYASHLTKSPIIAMDFRQDPYTEIYAVLEDGTAIVGRFNGQEAAWARIVTRANDYIENVCCIRHPDEDAVFFTVLRGGSARTLERLMTVDEDAFATRYGYDYGHHHGSFTAGNTLTISQFTNLTGIRARLLTSSGEIEGSCVFNSSGNCVSFTPDSTGISGAMPSFTEAHFGFPYLARLKTFRLDANDTEGAPKNATAIHFRCYATGPFSLVRDAVGIYQDKETFPVVIPTLDGATPYPYTGPIRHENMGPWSVDQAIILEAETGATMGIQNIVPQIEVSEVL